MTRKENQGGQVSLYDHHHRVGLDYAGQVVEVRFGASSGEWRFLVGTVEVGRRPAFPIRQARIVGLELGSRPGRSARETAARKVAGANKRQGP